MDEKYIITLGPGVKVTSLLLTVDQKS